MAEEKKEFRSLMWEFRTPPQQLKPERKAALDDLFERIPGLGFLYHFRWELTDVFETATDRDEAERRIGELREAAAESEFAEELEAFFGTYDRWREGILAYFEDHKNSGVVEGINNKARVINLFPDRPGEIREFWQRDSVLLHAL